MYADKTLCPKFDLRVYGDHLVGEGYMPGMLNDASDFALKRHLNVEGAVATTKLVMRNGDANATTDTTTEKETILRLRRRPRTRRTTAATT